MLLESKGFAPIMLTDFLSFHASEILKAVKIRQQAGKNTGDSITMTNKINNKTFYKQLLLLAFPIALQSLMLAAVAAGDALMLGRIAQDEMTAVSLATQIQFVQNMFLLAITGAGTILGAQYWGKGDRLTVQDLFNLMLRFSGLVS